MLELILSLVPTLGIGGLITVLVSYSFVRVGGSTAAVREAQAAVLKSNANISERSSKQTLSTIERLLERADRQEKKLYEVQTMLNTQLERHAEERGQLTEKLATIRKELDSASAIVIERNTKTEIQSGQIAELERKLQSLEQKFEAQVQLTNEARTARDQAQELSRQYEIEREIAKRDLEKQKALNSEIQERLNVLEALVSARDEAIVELNKTIERLKDNENTNSDNRLDSSNDSDIRDH